MGLVDYFFRRWPWFKFCGSAGLDRSCQIILYASVISLTNIIRVLG